LDDEVLPIAQSSAGEAETNAFLEPDAGADLPLEAVEKTTILKTLASADGNKSEAARRLGITRKTLHKKLKRYGVMP
jgi:two-component system response regulator HydG